MDIDDMIEVTEHPQATGHLHWGDPEDDDSNTLHWGTEGVREIAGKKRAERVRFSYTVTQPRTGESERVEYNVPLDYTECNFGGVRPWFRCPNCRDRRRKLYFPPNGGDGRYLCRECYDLGYRSSRTSGDELERAEQRYRKAFAKADAENRRPHPNNAPFLPDRPKGMHQDTFDDLLDDVREAEREWYEQMTERMRELLARSQTVTGPTPSGE